MLQYGGVVDAVMQLKFLLAILLYAFSSLSHSLSLPLSLTLLSVSLSASLSLTLSSPSGTFSRCSILSSPVYTCRRVSTLYQISVASAARGEEPTVQNEFQDAQQRR